MSLNKIPLNPPLQKGDFKGEVTKRGIKSGFSLFVKGVHRQISSFIKNSITSFLFHKGDSNKFPFS